MMLNLPPMPGQTLPRTHPSPKPNHMKEALALVREGRLQEATAMLMGHNKISTDTDAPTIPVPFQATQRFSKLAARGFGGVQDALNKLEPRSPQATSVPLSGASSAHTPWTIRPTPDTQAPASSASDTGRFERVAFTHKGVSHSYALYTPNAAAPADGRPLVMMLHGCTQDAHNFARGTRMNAAAESAGAMVLYPTQSQSANSNRCWNWFRPEDQKAGAGEPALLLAMVQHALADQSINRHRVYVAGLSAGGAMAAVLAQQYPEVFAAVGVHSGLAPGAAYTMMGALSAMKSGAKGWNAPSAKADAGPVPMIVLHGDADLTVHQRNGEQLLEGATSAAPTAVETQEKGVCADGQRYTRTCVINPDQPDKVLAEHWLLHGAGHAWSGGDARGSYACAQGVNASAEMLRFFLTHRTHGVKPVA